MHKESCLCNANAEMYAFEKNDLEIWDFPSDSEVNVIMEWRNDFWIVESNLELEIDLKRYLKF